MSGLTWRAAAGATLMLGLVLLGSALNHYRKQNEAALENIALLKAELGNAYAALQTQQALQEKLRELDARYSGELADAKSTIENLERDVVAGNRRLQLNAACGQQPVPGAGSAAGMDDGDTPRLNDAAQRDYFTLRERIDTVSIQVKGLQEYIRTQCR